MAIVIRTLFNNQQWQAACLNPRKDERCAPCFHPNVNIKPPSINEEGICTGKCWEQYICTKYRWGCTPVGSKWGERAEKGIAVFFVFRDYKTGLYTLWGHITVKDIAKQSQVDEFFGTGNYIFMYFNEFEALPPDKWVRGLRDYDIVGNKWLQGRHRYIDVAHEEYLNHLIAGEKPTEVVTVDPNASKLVTRSVTGLATVTMQIHPEINEKLKKIANEEGRNKDDIIKQAIAEWLRERER